MTKDEMKDKISMALKDPVLQQGFEIICKNLAELEKEAEEWTISHVCKDCSRYEECKSKERCTCKECSKEKWQNGAWFGYNKFMEELNQIGLSLNNR